MTTFRSLGYNCICFLGVLYYAIFRIAIAFCLLLVAIIKGLFHWSNNPDASPSYRMMNWILDFYWRFLFRFIFWFLRWITLRFLLAIGVKPEYVFLVTKKGWLGDILDHTEADGFTFSWGILGLSVTATLALLIYIPFLFTASTSVPTVDMSPIEDFD